MFRYFVIGLITSLAWFYQLAVFPSWQAVLWAMLLLLGFVWLPSQWVWLSYLRQIIIGFLVGFIWVFFVTILSPTLSKTAFFTPIEVVGKLVERPEMLSTQGDTSRNRLKLQLQISHWQTLDGKNDQAWSFLKPQIQLNWYQPSKIPKNGETWRFVVKLKPPHGSLNPGGFDYESYLYEKGIRAKGYVRNRTDGAQRLNAASGLNLRDALANHLTPLFENSRFQGIFRALIYGDKQGISNQDWVLLRQTGTIHLMVISGLHIGIMAAFGFALFAVIWRAMIRWFNWHWALKTPQRVFGAFGAILVATLYMSLAGYSIPTQRAWMMVVVVAAMLILRRQFQPWSALALAAGLIVIWHPASVMSSGFWLSFVAVAIIFKVLSLPKLHQAPAWQKMLWVQLSLTLGMMPILAGFYQQLAVGSLLANLIAVPFVSLLGLPFLFLTVAVSFISITFAQWLMVIHEQLWQALWTALQWIADRLDFWQTGQVSFTWVFVMYGGLLLIAWLLSSDHKRVWKVAMVGVISLGLGWFWTVLSNDSLAQGAVRMTVLDVGQGQAIVFETQKETVVYDSGPKWNAQFDGAKLAILPYLRSQRRQQVDLLIVSHSDQDHAGGTASLLAQMPVQQRVSGQAERLNQSVAKAGFQPCENGQAWLFSGVKFEILSPAKGAVPARKDNDTSCLLKVSTSQGSILVPGDLTETMEMPLITQMAAQLDADLLVAGHHGSQTSSSQAWLEAVSPNEVVISSGFANRFNFPSQTVVERLNTLQIPWRNTACDGAIQYKITANSASQTGVVWLGSEKQRHAKWVYSRCDGFAKTSRQMGDRKMPVKQEAMR